MKAKTENMGVEAVTKRNKRREKLIDPDVITPIDALKVLEKEGVYGSLHPYFYSTVGTGTTQAEAQRMANEMIDPGVPGKAGHSRHRRDRYPGADQDPKGKRHDERNDYNQ